jgi:DNA-binding MarR family transcriptional regulator
MHTYSMAGHVIRRLHQISTHEFTKQMQQAGFDLTPVQFAALDAIIQTPGIDQARVAAAIAYDRATIGGVIDRLEQKGFVTRKISRRDRRARVVEVTEKGAGVYVASLPVITALQENILPGLTPEERATFLQLGRKAVNIATDTKTDI